MIRVRSGPRRAHRGMVTVELAIGLVSIALVTLTLVTLARVGVAQAACAESAAQLARQTARADAVAVAEAEDRAPPGARIEVVREAEGVRARVAMDVSILPAGTLEVSADAWAAYEPGVTP